MSDDDATVVYLYVYVYFGGNKNEICFDDML